MIHQALASHSCLYPPHKTNPSANASEVFSMSRQIHFLPCLLQEFLPLFSREPLELFDTLCELSLRDGAQW